MDNPFTAIRFFGGSVRDVFQDADGRQYVFDDHGLQVHGLWAFDPAVWDNGPAPIASVRPEAIEPPADTPIIAG